MINTKSALDARIAKLKAFLKQVAKQMQEKKWVDTIPEGYQWPSSSQ
jgi:hypothetical protein